MLAGYGIDKELGSDKRIIALADYFTSVTVVSDKKYEDLLKDLTEDRVYAFEQKDYGAGKIERSERLKAAIGFEQGKETLISYQDYYITENLTRKLLAYVGSILCVSFLIGIASIIYTRLYSLADEESKKYKVMIKLGLSKKELKSILSSTVRWVFVVPSMTAFIISWVGFSFINRTALTSYTNFAVICSLIYLFMELILYVMIKRKYQRKIFDSVYEV